MVEGRLLMYHSVQSNTAPPAPKKAPIGSGQPLVKPCLVVVLLGRYLGLDIYWKIWEADPKKTGKLTPGLVATAEGGGKGQVLALLVGAHLMRSRGIACTPCPCRVGLSREDEQLSCFAPVKKGCGRSHESFPNLKTLHVDFR